MNIADVLISGGPERDELLRHIGTLVRLTSSHLDKTKRRLCRRWRETNSELTADRNAAQNKTVLSPRRYAPDWGFLLLAGCCGADALPPCLQATADRAVLLVILRQHVLTAMADTA